MVGAGGWGRGMGSECFTGTEFQFGKMKRVLAMDGGDGYLALLNLTLKNG